MLLFNYEKYRSKYENILNDYKSKNIRKMYDELNVKNTIIKNIKTENNKQIVEVELISRYMDYL